jgi:hypothetical protein
VAGSSAASSKAGMTTEIITTRRAPCRRAGRRDAVSELHELLELSNANLHQLDRVIFHYAFSFVLFAS